MTEATIAIIFKGLGMLLAIFGGVLVARYGFKLYRDGAGEGRDRLALEVSNLRLEAHSVGSIMMGTAFLWAWAGVLLSPDFEKSGDNYRVTATGITNPELRVPVFSTDEGMFPPHLNDADYLEAHFASTARESMDTSNDKQIVVGGEPAELKWGSVNAIRDDEGNFLISADVEAGSSSSTVTYLVKTSEKQLSYVPISFTKKQIQPLDKQINNGTMDILKEYEDNDARLAANKKDKSEYPPTVGSARRFSWLDFLLSPLVLGIAGLALFSLGASLFVVRR